MAIRRMLVGNRRFRVNRVIGLGPLVQIAFWSVVAVAGLTVYRTPTLLDAGLTVETVMAAVPVMLVPLVVGGVAGLIILLNILSEANRFVFGVRRRRYRSRYNYGYNDSNDEADEGEIFDGFDDFGDFDGGGDDW
jgi:hypothetical protein